MLLTAHYPIVRIVPTQVSSAGRLRHFRSPREGIRVIAERLRNVRRTFRPPTQCELLVSRVAAGRSRSTVPWAPPWPRPSGTSTARRRRPRAGARSLRGEPEPGAGAGGGALKGRLPKAAELLSARPQFSWTAWSRSPVVPSFALIMSTLVGTPSRHHVRRRPRRDVGRRHVRAGPRRQHPAHPVSAYADHLSICLPNAHLQTGTLVSSRTTSRVVTFTSSCRSVVGQPVGSRRGRDRSCPSQCPC